MVKAKTAGSFLGGIFNNPGVVLLGLGAVALFFFRNDIRGAFGALGEGLVNIQFPSFPSFPTPFERQFPEAIGGGAPVPLSQPGAGLPNPADRPTDPAPVDILLSQGVTDPRIINPEAFDPAQAPQLFDPTQFQPPIQGTSGAPTSQGATILQPTQPGGSGVPIVDELEVIVKRAGEVTTQPDQPVIAIPQPVFPVQTEIPGQQFQGGGPSFEGGVVRETPIEFLSLSQITEQFGVSASRAASLRAEAIGFSPGEEIFLNLDDFGAGDDVAASRPAVSDPMFEGLTPEEISLRLTGGNIQNF